MEKRRRQRINQSLNELKKLLLDGNAGKREVRRSSVQATSSVSEGHRGAGGPAATVRSWGGRVQLKRDGTR